MGVLNPTAAPAASHCCTHLHDVLAGWDVTVISAWVVNLELPGNSSTGLENTVKLLLLCQTVLCACTRQSIDQSQP